LIDQDYIPKEDIKEGWWTELDFQNIPEFSAVAYHFGKKLNSELNVPIGLISSNMGATSIEAWMGNEPLAEFEQFKPEVMPIIKSGKNFEQTTRDFEKMKPQWEKKYYLKGPGLDGKWYLHETDISDWEEAKGKPKMFKDLGLEDYTGAVWFRREFDLPEDFQGKEFLIQLNQLDDYDIAWVNGVKIGETFGRHNHRNYMVPVEHLKEKDNTLVVRILNKEGIGGFTTNAYWGNPIIWGDWKFKKGLKIEPGEIPDIVTVNVTPFSSPAVLYNANIAPLMPFAIKGAIWYQGESNAARAYEYRELLTAMIRDWRKNWGQGDFPFLIVQLANWTQEPLHPVDSEWAELREAQSMALTLPNTGMAVAIDLGEADNIHPNNKEDVGKRLGISALKVAYGQDVVHSGPVFKSMEISGEKAIIDFDYAQNGLNSLNKYGYLRGFQMAGQDQKFYWAKAYIKNKQVVVYSEKVTEPAAVRYGWAHNPGPLDLFNQEGLPAAPFRTDQWEGITFGKKFDESPRF